MILAGGPLATTADQFTDNISADQQKLAQNASALQQLQASIASAQLREPQLQAAIDKLNAQVAQTEALVNQNQSILDGITANLAATQAKLVAEQTKLAQEKDRLAQQLVIVYELQQQSTPINNLLTSHNFNDFWQSLIETRRISDQTNQVTAQVQEIESEVQADVDQIKVQQAQQRSVVAELVATKNQLAEEQATQQKALAAMQAAQAAEEAQAAQITASSNAVNNEIAQLNAQEQAAQAAASGGGGGGGGGPTQFAWPLVGPINQGFGCTDYLGEPIDPSCPYPHRFHNGLDIGGACGSPIRASAAGVVNVRPYDPIGFGYYIIIEHGGGWTTLYGHMLKGFTVGDGQHVAQGQQIGWEGSTGNSSGCHLHFGINTNNQWVNPLQYLP